MEAADGASRSRRTSIMSDSDGPDAIDGAFKRALKKVAPNIATLAEEEEQSESSFAGSQRSEVQFMLLLYIYFCYYCILLYIYTPSSFVNGSHFGTCYSDFGNKSQKRQFLQ